MKHLVLWDIISDISWALDRDGLRTRSTGAYILCRSARRKWPGALTIRPPDRDMSLEPWCSLVRSCTPFPTWLGHFVENLT